MSGLTNTSVYELSEIKTLRDRRDALLREVDRHRYRLHRKTDLLEDLRHATNDLMKLELAARREPVPQAHRQIEPLGDAGAAGGFHQRRLPYKD